MNLTAMMRAARWGALGGFLGFVVGEWQGGGFADSQSWLEAIFHTARWCGLIGLMMGGTILIADNLAGLRGQWHRNLPLGLPLFWVFGGAAGALGQAFFGFAVDALPLLGSLSRGLAWALVGAGLGAVIGLVRRDPKSSARGALGGLLGGFVGGAIFDSVAVATATPGDSGALARCIGLVITGAAIALGLRLVQEAFKTQWLLGISTGPYEGREHPLSTQRVTVGRDASNDIALWRDETVPPQLGALVWENGKWWWQGGAIEIDGTKQTRAPLDPGAVLQLGTYRFRYLDRSRGVPIPAPAPVVPVASTQTLVLRPTKPFLPTIRPRNGQTLGRAPSNDWVISDVSVSGGHARFALDGGVLSVRDLGSTNGTWVNGAQLVADQNRVLQAGDKVKFGAAEFNVEAE